MRKSMRKMRKIHQNTMLFIIMLHDMGGRYYDARLGPDLPTVLMEQYA